MNAEQEANLPGNPEQPHVTPPGVGDCAFPLTQAAIRDDLSVSDLAGLHTATPLLRKEAEIAAAKEPRAYMAAAHVMAKESIPNLLERDFCRCDLEAGICGCGVLLPAFSTSAAKISDKDKAAMAIKYRRMYLMDMSTARKWGEIVDYINMPSLHIDSVMEKLRASPPHPLPPRA